MIWRWILKLFAGVFSDWLVELEKIKEAEAKGALELERRQKEVDDEKIAAAMRARDAVDPAHVVPDDPDFRD